MRPKKDADGKITIEQHFVARFHLKLFCESPGAETISVFRFIDAKWRAGRSTASVGFRPHNCSAIGPDGKLNDSFDKFLQITIENYAVEPMKELAAGSKLTNAIKMRIAKYAALTAARTPSMLTEPLNSFIDGFDEDMTATTQAMADQLFSHIHPDNPRARVVELLTDYNHAKVCEIIDKLYHLLMNSEWHPVATSLDEPFIISDSPVYGQKFEDGSGCFFFFPVSSQLAFFMVNATRSGLNLPSSHEVVTAANRYTMNSAKEFVVSCRQDFPGCEHLSNRLKILRLPRRDYPRSGSPRDVASG